MNVKRIFSSMMVPVLAAAGLSSFSSVAVAQQGEAKVTVGTVRYHTENYGDSRINATFIFEAREPEYAANYTDSRMIGTGCKWIYVVSDDIIGQMMIMKAKSARTKVRVSFDDAVRPPWGGGDTCASRVIDWL